MILLRDPDCPPNCAGHPHVLETIPVFPLCLTATEGRSLQIANTFLGLLSLFNVIDMTAILWRNEITCPGLSGSMKNPDIATCCRHRPAAQMQRCQPPCLTQDFTSFILRPSYFQGELRSGQLLWSFSDDGSIARIRLFSQPVIFAAAEVVPVAVSR
jgi:hypothetical protein